MVQKKSVEEAVNFGLPWEEDYGYSQAVRAGNMIFLSGQLSHDERGNFIGEGSFEKQIRQTYANIKSLLGKFGLSLDNIVSETIYVTDLASQAETLSSVHKEYFPKGRVTSTVVEIKRLYFPQQLLEISAVAIK